MDKSNFIVDVSVASLMEVPISNWRPTLSRECNVYVFEEGYLAKPFNQIHYKFCTRDEAKEILTDNLFALLRIKYFKKISEKVDAHIKKIVSNFLANLNTTLQKVSFALDDDCEVKRMLPDYCVAFRNGVYDFLHDKWFFKYDTYQLEFTSNRLYQYDYGYLIFWYLNFDFEPLPIPQTFDGAFEYFRVHPTLCFKLLYNMAFSRTHLFDSNRFMHLCEIMGYTMLQSFCEKFVFLVGAGSNGKNSLFDGCFVDRLIPKPTTFDLSQIETDKYITSALSNKHLNIMLESSAKSVHDSKVIKSLTGSMYQSIISKRRISDGMINCRFLFSANSKSKIRFEDNTDGFRRRINVMEFFYQWDPVRDYLSKGDYYDVEFSNSLDELKNDTSNIMTYLYLGLRATKVATSDFTRQFEFSVDDWNVGYSSEYVDVEKMVSKICLSDISNLLLLNRYNYDKGKFSFYDCNGHRMEFASYDSFLQNLGKTNNILNGQNLYIAVWIIHDLQFPNASRLSELLKASGCQIASWSCRYKFLKVKIENDRLKVV